MWNVILLGLVSLLTDISSEMVYPLIPLYLVATLGATPAIVGVIEGFDRPNPPGTGPQSGAR